MVAENVKLLTREVTMQKNNYPKSTRFLMVMK